MKKKFFTLIVAGGLILPQFVSAKELKDASRCVHWNLGIVQFWTGTVTVDVYDDFTGELVNTYTEKCGKTTWLGGIFD